jgi:hypothetical protein
MVVVTDANQIGKTRTVNIIEPDPILINFATNIVCYGKANGWIKASPIQGTPPYTHHWENGMTSDSIVGLTPNQWYVDTVYDSRGCRGVDSVFVAENPEMLVHINNTDSSVCKNSSIQMDVSAFGGVFPYSVMWSPTNGVAPPNILEPLILPAFPQTYSIRITDTKGCIAADSITISIDSIPHASFSFYHPCQSREVHFTDQSSGNGTTIFEYLWDFGDGYQSTEQNPVHIYTGMPGNFNVSLTVTNFPGCSDYMMQIVYVNPVIQVEFSADTVCLGDNTTLTAYSLNANTEVSYWKWYFDDQDSVMMYPPQHTIEFTFAYAGIHSVMLELGDTS